MRYFCQMFNPMNSYLLSQPLKWLKKMLKALHVPFVEDCCKADETMLPVKYDKVAGTLKYYNPTTKTWMAMPA